MKIKKFTLLCKYREKKLENKDLIFENRFEYMKIALREAEKAGDIGEVPVGALIVSPNGKILAKAYNLVEKKKNSLFHAEMLAIQKAMKKVGEKYLMKCSMFVTLEPCPMCATAISLAKIGNLYFGGFDVKGGAVVNGVRLYENAKNIFKPKVFGGICEEEAKSMLKMFFKELREKKNKKLEN